VGHADVGGVEVAIDVEVADVAVLVLADVVGQPAQRQQVAGPIEGDAVVKAQALACLDLFGNGLKTLVPDDWFAADHVRMSAPQKSSNSRLI
jgi:hypothetical protein